MQDDSLTRKIKAAAETLDIRLDDHIIIADNGYYSYNDEGRL
jgi:DNA repair protein RadC